MNEKVRILLLFLSVLPPLQLLADDSKAEVRATFGGTRIFLDEPFSTTAGGSISFRLAERIGIEPQILFSKSTDFREVSVFGNAIFDLTDANRRMIPYLIAGAGIVNQTDKRIDFNSTDLTAYGGFGVRAYFSNGFFVAPEARLGFNAFPQITISIGYAIP